MRADLIATGIEFTRLSIVYHVMSSIKLKRPCEVSCPDDIYDKDLILKPTLVWENNMKVIYTPNNVWPSFYQAIFERTLNSLSEYGGEIENIYNIGDVVGHVMTTPARDSKGRFANPGQIELFS